MLHDLVHPYQPDKDDEPCECGQTHIWYDEWVCTLCGCQDGENAGIFLDWPDDDARDALGLDTPTAQC